VVWQKISYFGDALSHAVLLGLAIGAMLGINPILALIIFAIIFALLVFLNSHNRNQTKDSSVMIISYFCIALAIIFNDLWIQDLDFSSYIFGDILAAGALETLTLAIISVATIFYVIFATKKILLINLNTDLAQISGVKTKFWELSFLLLLALTIAITTHVIGIFLTTALLVLPAAIARIFAKSAKEMLIISVIFGITCACFSFGLATYFNLTIGSLLIAFLSVVFFLTKSARLLRR